MKWASTFSLLVALTASMAACVMHTKDSQPASEVRSGELSPEERYPTSLHARGPSDGRRNVYDDGPGLLSKAPYRDLPCHGCHPGTYADGTPVDDASYEPGCRDCHATPGDVVPQARCLGCHSNGFDRQSVHREAGLECMDCHTSNDVHGTGKVLETIYDPDAIEADCLACHAEVSNDSTPSHTIHIDTVDCGACHLETAETCYSCHLESYVEGGYQDRVLTKHDGFVMLVNHKSGKVRAATYQTIPWKGTSFVGILPTFNHTIQRAENARRCGDCHGNDAVEEYARTGEI